MVRFLLSAVSFRILVENLGHLVLHFIKAVYHRYI